MRIWAAVVVLCAACGADVPSDEAEPLPRGDGQRALAEDAGPAEPVEAARADPTLVPDTAHCRPVADWELSWAELEDEVLRLTNEVRAAGYDCRSEGVFEPAPPLAMDAHLRCAARLHAQYMAREASEFAHETAAGVDPNERISMTGYDPAAAGENIAVGIDSAEAVVAGWLASDGHCRNLMTSLFTEIGVGYAMGEWETETERGRIEAPYWTQSFGSPKD